VVAFCFGALLEALAGFGAPVAICSVMLGLREIWAQFAASNYVSAQLADIGAPGGPGRRTARAQAGRRTRTGLRADRRQ
jgi:L-lactate permease